MGAHKPCAQVEGCVHTLCLSHVRGCQDLNGTSERMLIFLMDLSIMIHNECHGLSLKPELNRALENSHAPAPYTQCGSVTPHTNRTPSCKSLTPSLKM